MNEITHNKLNSTEAITKNLPKIIEAFVTFYGESERENIENKFKNMLVIGYCKPEKIMNIIYSDQKQKSLELIDSRSSDVEMYNLSNSDASTLGMVCGGKVKVVFEYI